MWLSGSWRFLTAEEFDVLETYTHIRAACTIITYVSPVWTFNLSPTNWKKIEAFQSKILRTITGQSELVTNAVITTQTLTVQQETNITIDKIRQSYSEST